MGDGFGFGVHIPNLTACNLLPAPAAPPFARRPAGRGDGFCPTVPVSHRG